jgi:hypothetical protein
MIFSLEAPSRSAARVAADAIGALSYMRDRDGDDMLDLRREVAFREDGIAEFVKCRCGTGCELASHVREVPCYGGIEFIGHWNGPFVRE